MADNDALRENVILRTTTDKGSDKKEKPSRKRLIMIGSDGVLGLLIIGGGVRFMMGLFYSLLLIKCEMVRLKVDLDVPMHHLLPLIKTNLKIGRYRSPFLCVDADIQYTNKNRRNLLVNNAATDELRFDVVNILSIK